MSEIYSGIVLENGTSPVKVWLPYKDSYASIGEVTRGVGANLQNMSEDTRMKLLQNCNEFYQCTPISPGGEAMFDAATGNASVQDGVIDFNNEVSVAVDPEAGQRYSVPGSQDTYSFPQSAPAFNLCLGYVLQPDGGFGLNSFQNRPKGQFVRLQAGQRVLCTFIDNGRTGVILASLPWKSNYSDLFD